MEAKKTCQRHGKRVDNIFVKPQKSRKQNFVAQKNSDFYESMNHIYWQNNNLSTAYKTR